MSVSGSNQACIVIILVLTIPGSAALTVIPFLFTLSANSRVKSNRASFVFPYTGIRAKRIVRRGADVTLPVLESILDKTKVAGEVDLGVIEIPVNQIVGIASDT